MANGLAVNHLSFPEVTLMMEPSGMLSPRRSWVKVFKNTSRRWFFSLNFNSVIFIFLMTASLMILITKSSPGQSDPDERLINYPAALQKVKFLITDQREKDEPQTKKPLEDKILSVFNQEVTLKNDHDTAATDPVAEKDDLKRTEVQRVGVRQANDKITESEEDFDVDEEFHPPTNSKKFYENIGSLLQTFVKSFEVFNEVNSELSKDLEEAQQSGLIKTSKNKSPSLKVFSTLKKMASFQSPTLKGGNRAQKISQSDGTEHSNGIHELTEHQEKLDVLRSDEKERENSASSFSGLARKPPASPSNRRDDYYHDNRKTYDRSKNWMYKSNESQPPPHLWIQDALKEPSRNQSANEIQSIYAILARRTSTRESSQCQNIVSFGKKSMKDQFDPDTTQLVCQDSDFEGTFGKGCIVYSFGIHDSWDFENSAAERGCKVWAFDVTIKEKPQDVNPNVRFGNFGLGPKDEVKITKEEEVQFYTLQTLVDKLKHSKSVITYLKVNLNGNEWPILEQVINVSPTIFSNTLQMGLTTHLHTALIDHTLYGSYRRVLKQLEGLGFQMFASKGVERLKESYVEPLLDNRRVALTNYSAFLKI